MRRWSVLLLVCAVANVLPLFAGRFLPFSDLPEHVAAIAALAQWSDPSFGIAEHYTFAIGESQYLLYHLAGATLSVVVGGAERANLVLLAATGIGWPYAVRALLRALGRDERLALFACPLFWSHALVIGLLPFVASVPLALTGIALGLRRRWALAVFGVLLFFVHVQGFAVFVLVSVALNVALGEGRKRLVWLTPGVAVAAGWLSVARIATRGGSLAAPGQVAYAPPRELATGIPFWAHDLWKGHVDEALAIAFWVLVCVVALDGARTEPRRRTFALAAPLFVALALYLVMPYRVGGGDMLNVRFAVFVPPFALLMLTPRRALAIALAAPLTLAGAALHAREIRLAQAEVGDFDRVLAAIPRGARVLSLHFRFASARTHFPPWIHLAAYHRVRSGGIAEPSFAVLGHWPLHYREGAAPPTKDVDFWEFEPCAFRNAIDGPHYDHVIVRGAIDPFRDLPPGPVFRAVLRERDWTLFARVPGADNPAEPVHDRDRGPCVR